MFCWFSCYWLQLEAQPPANLPAEKCNTFPLSFKPDSIGWVAIITPDSLTLFPSSLRLVAIFPNYPMQWKYDLQGNQLIFYAAQDTLLPDSVRICYRLMPIALHRPLFRRSQTLYDSGLYGKINSDLTPITYPSRFPREQVFNIQGLQKNGSLTRGIAFGNRQDVFVQSALNLQLEGNIAEDLHLTAVLTDQNVPFQPEGNTLQVRQFDRILMRLRHKLATFTAGDIVLQNPASSPSHFLRFYKNALGGMVETTYNTSDSSSAQAKSVAAIGVAKGRFVSQVLPVQEGVLGPYRLRGPEGERFVVVLANSEKVFLDNRLLTRGFNYDYVIDYNTGEITFTNRVVITRFSRVRVDVEFVSQNYARSILQATHQQFLGQRAEVFGQFYRESDNPRNPLLAQLSDQDKRLLAQAGDSLERVLAPAVFPVESWDANRILYYGRDTIINGNPYRFYQRAKQPNGQPLFSISFSEVGFGKGDYIAGSPTANGREFVWVGIGQGNYAPVRLLPAPNEKQMATIGGSYRLHGNGKLFFEGAFSKTDLNRFSPLDNQDNHGTAWQIGYRNNDEKINSGIFKGAQWNAEVSLTRTGAHFRPIDRFRYIEFDRDWSVEDVSLGIISQPAEDYLWQIASGLRKENRYLQLKHLRRIRQQQVNGFQQWIEAGYTWHRWQFQTNAFLMKNQFVQNDTPFRSQWHRFTGHLARWGKYLVPGYQFSIDRNTVHNLKRDSIVATAMNFYEHMLYLRNGDSARFQLNGSYAFREDFSPQEGSLQRITRAHTTHFNWQKKTPLQWLNVQFTYRHLENLQSLPPHERTIMGRIDWNATLWQRAIRSEFTLANNSGREPRREFVFLQVNNGLGTHTWRDDNNDGIQQLNEFYLALNPDERNYVKFFTQTDQYIPAYANNLSWRLNLGFPVTWSKAKGWRYWASKLSNVSSWTVNRRLTDGRLSARLLPFVSVADSALLSTQEALRSTFFLNRTATQWNADLTYVQNRQKQLLTNGFEERHLTEWQLSYRRNFAAHWNVRFLFSTSRIGSASDFMMNRNFNISTRQFKPELAWQPSLQWRVAFSYIFQDKRSQENSKARFNELLTEIRWAQETRRNVQFRFKATQIFYQGEINSPLGYEMLEALQPGANFNWSINWQQRLGGGLQLTMQYEGRRSPMQPIAHIGRMQITALF
ncbi:MAG: hypothetical protein RMJ44_08345 [Cytophagales bacterium]|nr:hypothetical protein [Cytophagales bacterium]